MRLSWYEPQHDKKRGGKKPQHTLSKIEMWHTVRDAPNSKEPNQQTIKKRSVNSDKSMQTKRLVSRSLTVLAVAHERLEARSVAWYHVRYVAAPRGAGV